MPKVDATHPLYDKYAAQWSKCRDAVEGDEAVKRAGETYLPRLSGMEQCDYDAYRDRAVFYGASGRTVESLSGMIMRKPPTVKVPAAMENMTKVITADGQSLQALSLDMADEELTTGRLGLYVDAPAGIDNADPYVCIYYPENIINWRMEQLRVMIEGEMRVVERPTLVVLKEEVEVRDSADVFKVKNKEQFRVLILINDVYTVQLWERDPDKAVDADNAFRKIGSDIVPKRRGGQTLNYIPFYFVNPSGLDSGVEEAPLLDLVNVNLSHYRTTADLEHGAHFTALPTAVVTGADPNELGPLKIGSAAAWVLKEPTADAKYLEFTGAGLQHLRDRLKDKENNMAVLGARMLQEEKKDAESAQTMRLKQSGEGSALTRVAQAVGQGLTAALQCMAYWIGLDPAVIKDISVVMNMEFGVENLDGPTLTALLQSLQSGGLSWKSYHFNLRKAGYIPDTISEEDEQTLIEQGGPVRPFGENDPNNPQNMPPTSKAPKAGGRTGKVA